MKMIPGAKAASTRTGRSNPKNARLLLTFGPCLDRFSHFFQSTPQDLIDDGLYKTIALALHPMPHREVSMAPRGEQRDRHKDVPNTPRNPSSARERTKATRQWQMARNACSRT